MRVLLSDSGAVIEPNDPNWDVLQPLALAAKHDPQVWLGQRTIYGDLAEDAEFAADFALWLNSLWAKGTAATLRDYLG